MKSKLPFIDMQWFAGETTRLTDVIVPEIFDPYVVEKTAEKSRLRQSGIIGTVPGLIVPAGGVTVQMPFWNDLGGEDEVLKDDDEGLSPSKITAGKDVACVLARGKAWSAGDLATAFSGSDVMGNIADRVSDFWVRTEQKTLIAILKGIFKSASMNKNKLDISGEDTLPKSVVSKNSIVDAISLLGDSGDLLTGIVCHSAVMYDLAKKEMLDAKVNIGDTEIKPEFQKFLGRDVIADDGCPVETLTTGPNTGKKAYTTYLFGIGAIGFAAGTPPVPTETARNALAGKDTLVNRRHFILHPRGVKWNNADVEADEPTPGNAKLSVAANWTRVYESKNVRIVAFTHLIG